MAGPVNSYLTTQLAAQTAFNVPFGLLTLVNTAIVNATAAGEFTVTIDCSLFVAEDISNLRIYLDSLGYTVQYARDSNQKSLEIGWERFLDIPGSEIVVDQGTSPWIVGGTVSVANFPFSNASDGTTTVIPVNNSSTVLLATNINRKGYSIFNTSGTVYILIGSGNVSTTSFTVKLANQGFLMGDTYTGLIKAIRASGTADVNVTELV